MTWNDPLDGVRFLTGSTVRRDLLLCLREGPRSLRSIRDELDIAESTFHRNVTKLRDRGWIHEDTDRQFYLSREGRMILDDYLQLEETVEFTDQVQTLSDAIPLDNVGFELADLRGAKFTVSSSEAPYTAMHRFVSLLKSGDQVEVVTSFCNPVYTEVLSRRLTTGDLDGSVVVPRGQLSEFRKYCEQFIELTQQEAVDVHVAETAVPFTFGRVDDMAVLAGHRDGQLAVLAETNAPSVRNWIDSEYELYKQRSGPVRAD